jgi:hypothetical protein
MTPDLPNASVPRRWFREPMVWLVIGGPAAVVVASIASAVVAWKHIDPVIVDPVQGRVHVADDMSLTRDPKSALAPAKSARNHVTTPAN